MHVTCVSLTSAKIEWSPGNSSFSHDILLNGNLHRTVRPGTFQHTITNLEPDQLYKVHVRAKDPKRVSDGDDEDDIEVDLLTAETEFRTEPGGTLINCSKTLCQEDFNGSFSINLSYPLNSLCM